MTFYVPAGVYQFEVFVLHVHGTTYLSDPADGYLAVLDHRASTVHIEFVPEHASTALRGAGPASSHRRTLAS